MAEPLGRIQCTSGTWGCMAPVPPSREAANNLSESEDGLLVFGATVTAMPHAAHSLGGSHPEAAGFLQGTRAKGPGAAGMVPRKSSVPAPY